MSRLIDADNVQQLLAKHLSEYLADETRDTLERIDITIGDTPTVKAVPIEVLQEIRAEIDEHCSDNRDRNDGLYIAMRIIDKHLPGTGEIYPGEFED